MSEDEVYVAETVVTLKSVNTIGGLRDLIYLANESAPEHYRHVVAGRIINGHFQATPLMDFALSPTVLRKIADLIDGMEP